MIPIFDPAGWVEVSTEFPYLNSLNIEYKYTLQINDNFLV